MECILIALPFRETKQSNLNDAKRRLFINKILKGKGKVFKSKNYHKSILDDSEMP